MEMTRFNKHTRAEAEESKLKPIEFPGKKVLLEEIELGKTKDFIEDLKELPNSKYKRLMTNINIALARIKKSPIPVTINRGEWKILNEFTLQAHRYCPIPNLVYVCSYKIDKQFRIVYEIYQFDDEIKLLFTNCNIHVYRNWLYTLNGNLDNYRNTNIQ